MTKLPHTDEPCAACAEDARRARTLLGRIGSRLVDLGLRLGGLPANDPKRPSGRRGGTKCE